MSFRFRYDHCVPDGFGMSSIQRVYCMGSWQDGPSTFAVLRHPSTERAWCLRYPTSYNDEFVGVLFRDVHCDRRVNADGDYLTLAIRRDTSHPMTSLCNDDYEACKRWLRPCSYTGSVMQVCCVSCAAVALLLVLLVRDDACVEAGTP